MQEVSVETKDYYNHFCSSSIPFPAVIMHVFKIHPALLGFSLKAYIPAVKISYHSQTPVHIWVSVQWFLFLGEKPDYSKRSVVCFAFGYKYWYIHTNTLLAIGPIVVRNDYSTFLCKLQVVKLQRADAVNSATAFLDLGTTKCGWFLRWKAQQRFKGLFGKVILGWSLVIRQDIKKISMTDMWRLKTKWSVETHLFSAFFIYMYTVKYSFTCCCICNFMSDKSSTLCR